MCPSLWDTRDGFIKCLSPYRYARRDEAIGNDIRPTDPLWGGRVKMAFCTKCGSKNVDDAAFCKDCGAPIPPATPEEAPAGTPGEQPGMYPPGYELDRRGRREPRKKDFDKECEEECQEGSKEHSWVWALIIILIGLFIIFEAGIKNIDGVPDWVKDVQVWWVIPVLIGIMIISFGFKALTRSGR